MSEENTDRAVKGQWVRIHRILLKPEERSANLPEDTGKVPVEMWNKGFLIQNEAVIGQEVAVQTVIGRKEQGTLIEIEPSYHHDFGGIVPELLKIGPQLRAMLHANDHVHHAKTGMAGEEL